MKFLENIYLIKCVIFLCIGVILNSQKYEVSISFFALSFLMSVFHLDMQINNRK